MTDKEKAIVMAHTGICMLKGDKFQIFHKYVEDIMGRPIMTHEIGWLEDEIKEKSKADFIALCADESISEESNNWTSVSERLPEDGAYLVTIEGMNGEPVIAIESFAKDLNKVGYFNFPKHKCGWYDYDNEYGYWEDTEVIAWMPLPLPCKQKL